MFEIAGDAQEIAREAGLTATNCQLKTKFCET